MRRSFFLAIPLVEKQIKKLQDYFRHVSAESLIRILKASSRREEFEAKVIKKICEDCRMCKMTTRKVNKKKTALPKATGFNQVVSLDLKFHKDSDLKSNPEVIRHNPQKKSMNHIAISTSTVLKTI